MTPWPVSLCLLCEDEAAKLEKFFDHVRPLVREIVVVDSGSNDGSVEIAQRRADILVVHPLDDFSSQRNLASSKATHRWVLHLDADETLAPELVDAIDKVFDSGSLEPWAAYCFPRKTFDEHGHLRRIVESYPGFHYRLYDKTRCRWVKPVHETLEISGPKKFIPHHILHYPDYARVPRKLELYEGLNERGAGEPRSHTSPQVMLSNFLFHARALFLELGMWKRPADFLFACRWLLHQAHIRLRRAL